MRNSCHVVHDHTRCSSYMYRCRTCGNTGCKNSKCPNNSFEGSRCKVCGDINSAETMFELRRRQKEEVKSTVNRSVPERKPKVKKEKKDKIKKKDKVKNLQDPINFPNYYFREEENTDQTSPEIPQEDSSYDLMDEDIDLRTTPKKKNEILSLSEDIEYTVDRKSSPKSVSSTAGAPYDPFKNSFQLNQDIVYTPETTKRSEEDDCGDVDDEDLLRACMSDEELLEMDESRRTQNKSSMAKNTPKSKPSLWDKISEFFNSL